MLDECVNVVKYANSVYIFLKKLYFICKLGYYDCMVLKERMRTILKVCVKLYKIYKQSTCFLCYAKEASFFFRVDIQFEELWILGLLTQHFAKLP